jgi:hypothetical protein
MARPPLSAHLCRNRLRGVRTPCIAAYPSSRNFGLHHQTWLHNAYDTPRFGPVLAPAGKNDEERSFRVIHTKYTSLDKVIAFVFSSCNQTWRGIISTICLPKVFIEYVPYYAHDCIYWVDYRLGYSLMLDTSEMKFSVIALPPHNRDSVCAIVEAEEGKHGFLTIGDGTIDLYYKNWQRNGVGAQEWQHKKRIPLPKDFGINYRWEIEGTAGCYLALVAHHIIGYESPPNSEHFVLDMKTLLVEKLCTSNNGMFYGFPYARFPPLLALPSI